MRSLRFIGTIGLAGSLLFSATAHSTDTPQPNQPTPVIATGGVVSSLLAAPVVGEPFSATQVHTTTQTLADGTTISHKGHHVISRDASGRVHVEIRMATGAHGSPGEAMVFVMDPVTHTLTTWVANAPGAAKRAAVFKLPAASTAGLLGGQPPSKLDGPPEDRRPQPIVTVADLGSASIDGLEASGKRTTTILPIGRSGNNAPITKVHEVWTSPEMQLVLKQHWTDPRSGEKIVELQDLSRADPNPALFEPPAGYQVQTASETLKQLEEKLNATE